MIKPLFDRFNLKKFFGIGEVVVLFFLCTNHGHHPDPFFFGAPRGGIGLLRSKSHGIFWPVQSFFTRVIKVLVQELRMSKI